MIHLHIDHLFLIQDCRRNTFRHVDALREKKTGNSNRLMIVCALVDGERSVRDLEDTLQIRQPGLSQQICVRQASSRGARNRRRSTTAWPTSA